MQDAWRAYLELALGLSETSRKKATEVVKRLAEQSGTTVEQLQNVVEDLVSTSVANREAVTNLVRFELDRALGKVGLATGDEVAALATRVQRLEMELRAAQERADAAERAAAAAAARDAVRATAKKAAPKKKAAKKTAAKAAPRKTTAKKTTAKKAAGKKTGARKAQS